MAEALSARWTRLMPQNTWAVHVVEDEGRTPKPGDEVVVKARNGNQTKVTIDSMIWRGKDKYTGDDIVLCGIKKPPPRPSRGGYYGGGGYDPEDTNDYESRSIGYSHDPYREYLPDEYGHADDSWDSHGGDGWNW